MMSSQTLSGFAEPTQGSIALAAQPECPPAAGVNLVSTTPDGQHTGAGNPFRDEPAQRQPLAPKMEQAFHGFPDTHASVCWG